VAAGIAQWAPAFDASCPFPFTLDQASGKKFVALVAAAAWDQATRDPGHAGYTATAGIYVEVDADKDHRAIITHEFGHAMGLQHVSRLTSIMYPTIADLKVPDAQDFKDARAAMGCP
jgi:Matrixin